MIAFSSGPSFLKGGGPLGAGIRSILLIQLGDIGDVVLTLPCLRALRERFPAAGLFVAVREKARALVEACPWADGVLSVDKRRRGFMEGLAYQARFLRSLRGIRADLVFDLRTGTRGAFLAMLSGARRRAGFHDGEGSFWRRAVFTDLHVRAYTPGEHVSTYLLSLPGAFGIAPSNPLPELPVGKERLREVERLLAAQGLGPGEPYLVLQPFSLWRYKEWGPDRTRALLAWLRRSYGMPVLLIGSAEEQERAGDLTRPLGRGVLNLAGKTPLGLLPALLAGARLFIGIDSAGIHIAGAVGTPTVAIFGPSSPASWAPIGKRHRVVQKALPCVPCRRKGCEDTEVSRCLEGLTLEEVTPAILEQMALHGRPRGA